MIGRSGAGAALACLAVLTACDRTQPGVTPAEMDAIRRWLSCEECDQGERQALVGLSPEAAAILVQALDTGSAGGRALLASLAGSAEAELALLPEDPGTDAAIRYFTQNELRRVQERAAMALGDLGAAAEIENALDERVAWGLDDDVVRALESALLQASPGAVLGLSVSVALDSVELEEGSSMVLSALVLDAVGSALQGETVTWTLAHPPGTGAVSLDSSGALTALAPGVDTVVATHAGGSQGRVTVRVVPRSTIPVLGIVGGDHQSDTVGSLLPAPVVVQATAPGGAPAPGVPVTWAVASGGGALVAPQAVTGPTGRAQAGWRLGDTVGPQRIRVSGPDGLRIAVRAQGLPALTTIQGVIVNDRDGDANTIDPGEALPDVPVGLYVDGSPPIEVSPDSLVAVDTTDAVGAFGFTGLPPGTYVVRPDPGPFPGWPVRVLRSEAEGDTAVVKTAGPRPPPGSGNPDATLLPGGAGRTVGITAGFTGVLMLPRWDADNGVMNLKGALAAHRQPHFTFVFTDGTAMGRVIALSSGSGVAGATVAVTRCASSSGATSPPTPGAGSCVPSGPAATMATDAAGDFSFSSLREGVWRISVDPASAGLPGPVIHALYRLVGRTDVEAVDLIIPKGARNNNLYNTYPSSA